MYGVNKELFSNDGFLVYPENSLGTNYYTCSWAPSTLDTEFAVVATQDNTNVSIKYIFCTIVHLCWGFEPSHIWALTAGLLAD